MQGCLSEQDMAVLVAGTASSDRLALWKRHLRVCDSCAASVTRLRAGLPPGAPRPPNRTAPPGASDASLPAVGLEPNLRIGDFQIERRLGSGGMGVVYQALQLSLQRRVALKVLPFGGALGPSAIERFHREARAAARLHHPNIVTIHAEGAEGRVCYFAMEMIEGESLDQVIQELRARRSAGSTAADASAPPGRQADDVTAGTGTGPLPRPPCVLRDCASEREYFRTVARLTSEVADALEYAHGEGIIHRDVKPSNLMLSRDGRLVLLDFGIARSGTEHAMTMSGSFLGTPRYMSPEQIAGDTHSVDRRGDVYSLGVTLYELLTLEPLFPGDTQEHILSQILHGEPRRPRQVNRRIPVDLQTICTKAIEKDPQRRYATAGAFAEDLRRYLHGQAIRARRHGATDRIIKLVGRHKSVVALAGLLLVASSVAAALGWQHHTTRWAQQYALAEIDRLMEQDRYFAALRLAEKAARYIPDDPLLADRWPRLARTCSVTTRPSGARIYIRDYYDTNSGWKYLGRSPLAHVRIPFGACRWKVKRPGFMTTETIQSNDPPSPYADRAALAPQELSFTLHEIGSFPDDMVWIPPSELDQKSMFHGTRKIPAAPAYLIDKYEVTNRQFQEFVDSGAYEDSAFWREPFVKDGNVVSWSQAMSWFRDQTGRPGPATWRDGRYPAGQEDYPVGGISWYEAAAYARFRDKDLPTIFHWAGAARADEFPSRITRWSNFGVGPAPVGRHPGMGKFGLYDAAGNVREWCCNAIEKTENRCILGGMWGEHDTAFINGAFRSPWDRHPGNGVRCVKYLGGRETVPEPAFTPVEYRHRDFANFQPVSEETFASYIDMWYRYDRTELNAKVESGDEDLGYCLRERVTFDAAYPNERVVAYLHLPKGVRPPYQAVVWFPSGIARFSPWDERAYPDELVSIIRSGRAVIVPFYKGTYDRRLEHATYPPDGIQSRNLYIQKSQDLRRSVDYLQTRADINIEQLAYVGLAWGAQMGPVMIATESRFKAGILLLGGICACPRHPASDPANFAPHVKIPILMLNGREDALFPLETAQEPLFKLLGTPPEHKKHLVFPGEHCIAWECRAPYHKEIADWLDKYLGLVRRIDN
jgi:serine/threonine protein kinase/dienelactone hydrolase